MRQCLSTDNRHSRRAESLGRLLTARASTQWLCLETLGDTGQGPLPRVIGLVSNSPVQNARSQGPGQVLEAGGFHSVAPLIKHAWWEPWLSVAPTQIAQEKAESLPGVLPTSIWWDTGAWISPSSSSCSGAPSMTLLNGSPLPSFMFPGREGGRLEGGDVFHYWLLVGPMEVTRVHTCELWSDPVSSADQKPEATHPPYNPVTRFSCS